MRTVEEWASKANVTVMVYRGTKRSVTTWMRSARTSIRRPSGNGASRESVIGPLAEDVKNSLQLCRSFRIEGRLDVLLEARLEEW